MAAAQFLITLTRTKNREYVVKGLLALITTWFLVSVFCVSFQCDFPNTWNSATGKCFNTVSLATLLDFWLLADVCIVCILDCKLGSRSPHSGFARTCPRLPHLGSKDGEEEEKSCNALFLAKHHV